jgi:hypothetical protein
MADELRAGDMLPRAIALADDGLDHAVLGA